VAAPVTKLSDAPELDYVLSVDAGPGEHTIAVRVQNEYENLATDKGGGEVGGRTIFTAETRRRRVLRKASGGSAFGSPGLERRGGSETRSSAINRYRRAEVRPGNNSLASGSLPNCLRANAYGDNHSEDESSSQQHFQTVYRESQRLIPARGRNALR
jgi:hypothetical protein